MYSYVTEELPELVASNFPLRRDRQGIFGHSMGGHGALVCALRNQARYRSLSAVAPISHPSSCPWGINAFTKFLGPNKADWQRYDATELMRRRAFHSPILLDQGLSDKYLVEQLMPDIFEEACHGSDQTLMLRRHAGYDHGYFFVQTVIADHLKHHASILQ